MAVTITKAARRLLKNAPRAPAYTLLLRGLAARDDSIATIREAASDAVRQVAAELGGSIGAEDRVMGHWSVTAVGECFLIQISEDPDDVGALVEAFAEVLSRRGACGELDVLKRSELRSLPATVELLECRMRPVGHRVVVPGRAKWVADREAFSELMANVVAWCAAPGGGTLSGQIVGKRPIPLDSGATAVQFAQSAAHDGSTASVLIHCWLPSGGLRVGAFNRLTGQVSAVACHGASEERAEFWLSISRDLEGLMVNSVGALAYGFVKRGTSLVSALGGDSLSYDWPPRQGIDLRSMPGAGLEDCRAPDAFHLQLLGPGYGAPDLPSDVWSTERLPGGAHLVRHRQPDRWVERSFAPVGGFGGAEEPPPVPPVLADARRDFDPLLVTAEMLRTPERFLDRTTGAWKAQQL